MLFDVCTRHAAGPTPPPAHELISGYEDAASSVGDLFDAGHGSDVAGTESSELQRAKRKRELLEVVRMAPGPDARKARPAWIDAVWEEMRASDRSEAAASAGQVRCSWNFGASAKSSYLEP